ncbi:MAG TPA: ABC transporter ATP-binding protein [Aggregatilineales bacterium]|jgi:ATP-binding cassette subfamily B protein|nr:ABC transporter ATP-binding protein [Aggregatilineales bacterium]HPV07108.1 ABC transporter ATP-binding protein [Aggregatilineales bacterium]HQA67103.1 ABC transporter ATP-binding protein [Aggregatilineales bacterium]HQE17675.1 ABC transporter ATP-binding protein [Aggregatilineales bacterium]
MYRAGWHAFFRAGDESPQVTWPLIKRVLRYGRPYRLNIALMLLAILLTTGLGLLTPLILRDLIDNTLPNRDVQRLNLLAIGLVLIPLVSGGIRVLQRRLSAAVGEGVIYDLRVDLYTHLQRMSLRFFTHTKTGELMSRLNNDVVGAQRAISSTIVDIITQVVQAVSVLAVMLALEWRLTLLALALLPLFILAARRLGNTLRDIQRERMDDNARMNAMMNETLNVSGALLVKLFGRTNTEIERFRSRAARVRDSGVTQAVLGAQFFMLIGLIGAIGTALVYWLGGHLVLRGAIQIGTIVALTAYLSQLYASLSSLTNAPVDFATSMVSFERVFEVVDLPLDIAERPGAISLGTVEGRLTFDNVTFKYEVDEAALLSDVQRHSMDSVTAVLSDDVDANGGGPAHPIPVPRSQAREHALENISFTIEPGQLVALVGPSGAGKTTLTYLIPRLYDPTEGRILIDGHDLRDVTLESLAANIGMVTQETYLFHDTILTNLLYAKLDATQEEVEEACRAANIHDFIMGLPNGYHTIVGERGYRLSGGEKQRLAIARVILKNPRILVLDEATSHLDSQSEALIQEALQKVLAGRTSVVIAHRLSTILAADQILVMDRGRIVERGTHDDLLAQRGLYAQLYHTQFAHEAEAAD